MTATFDMTQLQGATQTPLRKRPPIRMREVAIGKHTVLASAGMDLVEGDLDPSHLIVPLTRHIPYEAGVQYSMLPIILKDFGGVPPNWRDLVTLVAREIKAGRRVHIFCDGGQGRTGTMLASLVSLIESSWRAPDPIAVVRARYHKYAVETIEQARAVFALRDDFTPIKYYAELLPPTVWRAMVAAMQDGKGSHLEVAA